MASTQNFWNDESFFDDPLSDLLGSSGPGYNQHLGATELPEKRKEDLGQPDNLHSKISKTSAEAIPNHTSSPAPSAKTAKKPGRKIDPNEPASKRKAQNRAAQRAFRERKEKHLRDLEDRVKELESEAATTNNENQYLKLQVERLQQELSKYRTRGSQNSTTGSGIGTDSSGQPKQFTFEFPFFPSSVKGNDTTTTNISNNNSNNNSNMNNNPYPSPQSIHRSSQTSSSSTSVKGLSPADSSKPQTSPSDGISPQSYSSSSPFTTVSQITTPHGDGCKDCKSGSFEEESFCDQLSLACGQKDDPVPKARLPSTFPSATTNQMSSLASSKPSIKPGIMKQTLPDRKDSSNADAAVMFPPFDLDFLGSYRDPLFENSEFQLPELQTNEFSLFDPLENPLMGSGSTEPSPASVVDSKPAKSDADEVVPAQTKPLMTCSAIWDRVSTHPKFNDLDIDGLCSELRSKAKCSESGVVLSEKDVDNVLASL